MQFWLALCGAILFVILGKDWKVSYHFYHCMATHKFLFFQLQGHWILLCLILFCFQDLTLCTHLKIELILKSVVFVRAWSGLLSVGFGLYRFFWTSFFVMIYVTKISITPNLWTEDICFSLCKYEGRQICLGWHHFSGCNWVILTVSAQLLFVKQILIWITVD